LNKAFPNNVPKNGNLFKTNLTLNSAANIANPKALPINKNVRHKYR